MPPTRVHALLLNGGGTKAQNFRSHLLHVQQLFAHLERAGVDRSRITIFSADGDDPEADLALRDATVPPDLWVIDGTRIEHTLRPPIVYGDTRVDDVSLRPATKPALTEWFADEGRRLAPGEVLLVYVTDHGTKNADDTTNNKISLWGHEELSTQELAGLLALVDPGVRVIMVMSQCYSGAFAGLVAAGAGSDRPPGNVCGYFSSTADRPAYGCYPENRGRDNVGHSFHFLEAFARTGRLTDAHEAVLVTDATPDVPLRTSDAFLEDLLRQAALADEVELPVLADRLLAEAWVNRKVWEPEIRQLDRIGAAFGVFSPRSLRELDEQSARIDALADQLKTHGTAWHRARVSLARANLDRFLASDAQWNDRIGEGKALPTLRTELDTLAAELLPPMVAAVASDSDTAERFASLRGNGEKSQAIGYRMDVRQGVVLRMRALLLSVAGRQLLATRGTALNRDTLVALRACEDLRIPPAPPPPGTELALPEPFPALADDVTLAQTVLPAWLGIQFRQVRDAARKADQLADGAATVLSVYEGSPAAAAGLAEGDVILGPPGKPFVEKEQIREWVMRRPPDVPADVAVLRERVERIVTLVPRAMPQKWPSLPGPPKVGEVAPALRLDSYRGPVPTTLADGRSRLLFFWATWCGICKLAVPELLAFGRERGVDVLTITDETAAELDPFFKEWAAAFPDLVAMDDTRGSFRAYGVSGTPTFVLIDGDGTVRAHATGYAKKKGIAIEGWRWTTVDDAPAAPGP